MVITKSIKQTLRLFRCGLAVALLWSCSSGVQDEPDLPDAGDEVVVTFSAGSSVATTRVAFDDGTPLKIFIYRQTGGISDFSAAPYKTVEGMTQGTADGLSIVKLTGGDVTSDASNNKILTVRNQRTYDFVVVVSGASGATIANISAPSSGVISGFTHGMDILASRETVTVLYDPVKVVFKGEGTDGSGNLPHLGSAVRTEGRVTKDLIDELGAPIKYALAGMDFNYCLPKSANLSFTNNPLTLIVQGQGFNTSYSANVSSDVVDISNKDQVVTSGDALLLPYPAQNTLLGQNTLNINFRLRVNGGEVLFEAPVVRTPSFNPGYRYTFIVELDYEKSDLPTGTVNLYLSIEPWSALFWQTGMGEDEGNTNNLMVIHLGSWSSVTWSTVMGGDDNSTDRIITSVRGWQSVAWTSIMGDAD